MGSCTLCWLIKELGKRDEEGRLWGWEMGEVEEETMIREINKWEKANEMIQDDLKWEVIELGKANLYIWNSHLLENKSKKQMRKLFSKILLKSWLVNKAKI